MKKKLILVLASMMIFSIFTGCASGGNNQSTSSKNQSKAPTTLVYAQSLAVTSLDPAGMQPQAYPSGYEAAFAIYNGLVRFDKDLKFVPDLAKSWTTSADGLEWTFKLRQGVKFQDGTDFNADAVVKQYTRMLDPKINIGAYSLWSPITKIEKIDDYTVKITTKAPYSAFLNVMAHGSALIPSPTAVQNEGSSYALHPVGTGPYKMNSFQPGTELDLTRYDDYYEGKPTYEKIIYRYVGDASARVAALKSGQADVIDAVPPEDVVDLKSDPNVDVIIKPALKIYGIALNQNTPALKDLKVRQALNYAVDKNAIAKALFMGYVTPLQSPLALNTTGSASFSEYKVDINKAKSLLDQAGWKTGSDGIRTKDGNRLDLTLITPDGMYPKDVTLCETIQNQLKDVGVNVTINKVEKSTYWNKLRVPAASDKYDMALWGYNPSHGNGEIQMDSLFTSNPSATSPPTLWNFIWYNNPSVDSLLNDAKVQVDSTKFDASMKAAEKTVWDECPYIWLYSDDIITAKRSDVSGVTVLPVVFTLVNR